MPPRKFKSRRLRRFYDKHQRGLLPEGTEAVVQEMLSSLDDADVPEDMDKPGWGWKEMKGDMAGTYRVEVNKKWRLLFRWENGGPVAIDLVDYH